MPGTFSETNRPRRPGAYFNFVNAARETILPSSNGTVAVPFVTSWGPDNSPVDLDSFEGFLRVFGDDKTKGYNSVQGAFRGEGLPGRGGAGTVKAYRYGGPALAHASVALGLVAKVFAVYKGTRGNRLSVTIRPNATAGRSEFVVIDGGAEIEKFVYVDTAFAALAAVINESSSWVRLTGPTATSPDSSVPTGALPVTSAAPLAGGADGNDFNGATFTTILDRLEVERFGLLGIDIDPSGTYSATPGTSIHASIITWAKIRNSRGQRVMVVLGGGLDELASVANARSVSAADPNIVNLGIGSYIDGVLGVQSSADLAPRYAGILAQRGEVRSGTFARFAGLAIRTGITEAAIEPAFDAGTTVITRDNGPAPVRIEKALTTYQANVADARDPRIFGVPKFVRTMHGIETEITEYLELNVVGLLPITTKIKDAVVNELNTRISTRIDQGIIQPGGQVTLREGTPDTADYLEADYVVQFSRSIEQIFNSVRVS